MPTRVEAVFFGLTAFLICAQILAGFASLVYPDFDSAASGAGRQFQVGGGTSCPDPASAKAQAIQAAPTAKG